MTLTDDLRKAMEAVRGLSHAVLKGEKPTEPVLAETLVPDEVRRTLRPPVRTEEVLLREGFWARLTGDSGDGDYSWVMLEPDGVTPVDPEVAGSGTATEVNGLEDIPVDSGAGEVNGTIVWLEAAGYDADDNPVYRFRYHANPGSDWVGPTNCGAICAFDIRGHLMGWWHWVDPEWVWESPWRHDEPRVGPPTA